MSHSNFVATITLLTIYDTISIYGYLPDSPFFENFHLWKNRLRRFVFLKACLTALTWDKIVKYSIFRYLTFLSRPKSFFQYFGKITGQSLINIIDSITSLSHRGMGQSWDKTSNKLQFVGYRFAGIFRFIALLTTEHLPVRVQA